MSGNSAITTTVPLDPKRSLTIQTWMNNIAKITGAAVNYGPTTQRPKNPFQNQFFFDTSLNQPIWWSGTAWVTASSSGGANNNYQVDLFHNGIEVGANVQINLVDSTTVNANVIIVGGKAQVSFTANVSSTPVSNGVSIAEAINIIVQNQPSISIVDSTTYLAAKSDINGSLDYYVAWNQVDGLGDTYPTNSYGNIGGNTEIILAGPPTPVFGGAMQIQYISLVNSGANANVKLYLNDVGALTNVALVQSAFMQKNYTLIYDKSGFRVLNANGIPLRH